MNDAAWKHLFVDGEYAPRKQILVGLTLDQVIHKPSDRTHSIYEELWHTVTWQNIVVNRDEAGDPEWQQGHVYPTEVPTNIEAWENLVNDFFTGLDKALELASSPDALGLEVEPGLTMETELIALAVHNAYHMGKIVALRQTMGAWSPEESSNS